MRQKYLDFCKSKSNLTYVSKQGLKQFWTIAKRIEVCCRLQKQ
ncbi:unnamed protein product [Paramecium octaurelia]|uniref:Uncharacterized protein n=1 Tax=Paramecium octaurelia TaxID=43137 RepID=A0A8S1Y4W0_PAROT|nr:unnamed protein product [Paramecium octaurelia]